MNIVILLEKDKISENKYRLDDFRKDHLLTILKSEQNDIIQIGLLNDKLGEAVITKISDDVVELEISNLYDREKEEFKIDLICALPRPQTLKKVLHTCAAMGVNHLYLIRSEKVEKSYFHSPLLNKEKYNKFLIEGLSQGKRTKLPIVTIHSRFKKFFEEEFTSNKSTKLLAHPDCDNYLSPSIISSKNIVLAIGPEGGWNEYEIDFMEIRGFIKYKLSKSVLRVENAITASIAQIELVTNSN